MSINLRASAISHKSMITAAAEYSVESPTTVSGVPSVQTMRAKFYGATEEMDDFVLDAFIARLQLDTYNQNTAEEKRERLERIDAVELFTAVQELNREVSNLKIENYILIDFLEKNDPRLLIGLEERRATTKMSRRSIDTNAGRPSASGRSLRSLGTYSISQGTQGTQRKIDYRLNYRSKVEMAEKVANEIEKRIRDIENQEMLNMKVLNAQIEELKMLLDETIETANNFKLHFLRDERDLKFLEIASEKQLEQNLRKFVNNWIKNARALLATMRMRSTTMQDNCQQLRGELITKADLSGILSAVDFEQLIIKRDELIAELDMKNMDMAGLKGVTGKASLAMAKEKQQMMNIEEQSRAITQKTSDIIRAIAKLDQEIKTVEAGNRKDLIKLKELREQLLMYEAPSVNSYIEKKDELNMLEKEEKMLKRKIYILNMKLGNLLKRCKKNKPLQAH